MVPDVEAFPGHIPCASTTKSELVLPVRDGTGQLIGVFDLDSDQPNAFTEEDARQLAGILQASFANSGRKGA